MKLHLGCGQRYLDGYVNIDYPPEKHTVMEFKVDEYADITKLSYPHESIDEIRLHHVFEHFSRPVALALLCRWRDWLKVGGILRIETPDLMKSVFMLANPLLSFDTKQQVVRHLFGSHEADWAVHWDGWYEEKYRRYFGNLGFDRLTINRKVWGPLRNIEVIGYKGSKKMTYSQYKKIARELLTLSTVRVKTKDPNVPEGSEILTLAVWEKQWNSYYRLDKK
jgi:predicted SAM-dependent methyltransferase